MFILIHIKHVLRSNFIKQLKNPRQNGTWQEKNDLLNCNNDESLYV